MPFIWVPSKISLSPPLISQPCRFRSAVKPGSFPPGEAKRRLRELIPFNVPICSGNGGEPRRLRRSGRQVGDPYKLRSFGDFHSSYRSVAFASGGERSRPYPVQWKPGAGGSPNRRPLRCASKFGTVAKSHTPCRGRQPGDPLARSAAGQWRTGIVLFILLYVLKSNLSY